MRPWPWIAAWGLFPACAFFHAEHLRYRGEIAAETEMDVGEDQAQDDDAEAESAADDGAVSEFEDNTVQFSSISYNNRSACRVMTMAFTPPQSCANLRKISRSPIWVWTHSLAWAVR